MHVANRISYKIKLHNNTERGRKLKIVKPIDDELPDKAGTHSPQGNILA